MILLYIDYLSRVFCEIYAYIYRNASRMSSRISLVHFRSIVSIGHWTRVGTREVANFTSDLSAHGSPNGSSDDAARLISRYIPDFLKILCPIGIY